MSVVIETTLGDITVDLFLYERPRACLNFLKLCKIKYYNYNLFHTISRGFIAQTGDPTGSRNEGESIFAVVDGPSKKYFEAENEPRIKHTRPGLISFVGGENKMIASQFFLTLGEDLTYLDEMHCVFGEVVEGFEILESINEVICDNDNRPFQDVRITHTAILDDPYPDPKGLRVPSRSPSPSAERLAGGRIAPDEEIDEMTGKSAKEISEMQAEREAKARATILEMVGDIPDADMAPPENVLFVCKLNPITQDDDLEILFSRFGKIKSCEVIRDRKTGDSLQYAFIEFEDQKSCEDAYFKMDNVLVDDRRLHVDFSQSVSKVRWLGKGKGVINFDDKGNKRKSDINNDIGRGEYKVKNGSRHKNIDKERNFRQDISPRRDTYKSRSPRRERLSPSPEKPKRKSRSPQPKRTQSRSPKRQRSKSPLLRRKYNRSPDYPDRKNNKRRSRSPKRSISDSRRNINKYMPERKFGFSRRRSRSPLIISRSPIHNRRNNLNRGHTRSPLRNSGPPTRKSRSPSRRSSSPGDRSRHARENTARYSSDKRFLKDKHSTSTRSKSPGRRFDSPEEWPVSRRKEERRAQTTRENSRGSKERSPKRAKISSIHKSAEKADSNRDKSSKDKTGVKEMSSSEKARTRDQKSNTKVKKAKASPNKRKKSNKHDLSKELETDNEKQRKKSKKKKHRKKVESSTESSSSEESSSSSSEEEVRKSNKRKSKRVKKDKKKIKSSSSSSTSSDSTSDSDNSSSSTSSSSSSSSSESDNYKKKKSKKKKTKDSSDSD